ncbi:MAG TPA: O-antigen ligase family protein [Devosiaceae bacterium]
MTATIPATGEATEKSRNYRHGRSTFQINNRLPSRSSLAVVFAWPALVYLCGFSYFRGYDVAFLAFILISSAISAHFAKYVGFTRRYSTYLGWASLLFFLSLIKLMPDAWTLHREPFAAFRHYVVIPALPFLITAFLVLIRRYEELIVRYSAAFLILTIIVTRLSIFSGVHDNQEISIYLFSNENFIVCTLFAVFLFRIRRSLLIDSCLLTLFFFACTSQQSQIFGLAMFAIRVVRQPQLVAMAALVGTGTFVAVAPFAVETLHAIDHNTGVRALLWRDALQAVIQTLGLGVGFGTEYIKNDFSDIMYPGWTFVSPQDTLYVGTHSAYFDILLRTGVVGLVLLMFWYLPSLRKPSSPLISDQRFGAAIATMICITASVDMALTSLNYLFGCALGFAILHHLRSGTTLLGASRPKRDP